MSESPLDTGELARRVRVLGARVPDDGELERSSKWFKKYIKVSYLMFGGGESLADGIDEIREWNTDFFSSSRFLACTCSFSYRLYTHNRDKSRRSRTNNHFRN